jgi:outer membrane protein insertion porin family
VSLSALPALAQDSVSTIAAKPTIDYAKPQKYSIASIDVKGAQNLDKTILVSLCGLHVGQEVRIPGDDISRAIKTLWKQRLFTDVSIDVEQIKGTEVFLVITVEERPRIRSFKIIGVKSADADELRKKMDLRAGEIFTDSRRINAVQVIKKYYMDKGFMNVQVDVKQEIDTVMKNHVLPRFYIIKGQPVRIQAISISGNSVASEAVLRSKLKDTRRKIQFDLGEALHFQRNFKTEPFHPKWYQIPGNIAPTRMYQYMSRFVNLNILKTSKFRRKEYEDDKKKLVDFYTAQGYRDAHIDRDTVYALDNKNLAIDIHINEGKRYYFRNIYWLGNTKYSDSLLSRMLNIRRGEVYNQKSLDEKLFSNPNGGDVSSLYMDDGYLFFSVQPSEVRVDGDSIDVELRVSEGPQATINEVRILGNTKTSERVIRRELRTLPGNKFSRTDLIRSQREIVNLGYFDPQQLDVVPIPNAENGTVDIEYRVTEKPSDQLELSAGYGGAAYGFTGTLGLTFTNFSLRNIINKKAWNPLPSGDGQRLSLRIQSGGKSYQSYNFSFTEPWLGGKKPNSLTFAFARSNLFSFANGTLAASTGHYYNTSGTIGWATRLKFPDDFFTFESALTYQRYEIDNYSVLPIFNNPRRPSDTPRGSSNNVSLTLGLSRNSLDQPLYPKHGSAFSLSVSGTLPYSLMFGSRAATINSGGDTINPQDKFRWIEYFKVKFSAEWYTPIVQNLVFKASAKMGFLGYYNSKIGLSPFERFEVGGDGISTFSSLGKEIVRLRGYEIISPTSSSSNNADNVPGAAIFNKFSAEIRYPISLNQSATIFVLGFVEGGNTWSNFSSYRPYDLYKSVGIGVRVFLPMFGLLGVDYGFPLDKIRYDNGGTANPSGRANIILGQEPQ